MTLQAKILIATPSHDARVGTAYAYSILSSSKDLKDNGVECSVVFLNKESNITRARNSLVAKFLTTDFTHLMFIDSDMGWETGDIRKLLNLKKDFVAGVGVRKALPISFCCNLMVEENKLTIDSSNGCLKANEVGTGFMLLSRTVFDRMIGANPDGYYLEDHNDKNSLKIFTFFETKREGNEFYSEDYSFCRSWRKLHGEIWVDPTIKLQHFGEHCFEGKLQDKINEFSSLDIMKETQSCVQE